MADVRCDIVCYAVRCVDSVVDIVTCVVVGIYDEDAVVIVVGCVVVGDGVVGSTVLPLLLLLLCAVVVLCWSCCCVC